MPPAGARHRAQHLPFDEFHKLIKFPGQVVGVGINAVGVELREGGDSSHTREKHYDTEVKQRYADAISSQTSKIKRYII